MHEKRVAVAFPLLSCFGYFFYGAEATQGREISDFGFLMSDDRAVRPLRCAGSVLGVLVLEQDGKRGEQSGARCVNRNSWIVNRCGGCLKLHFRFLEESLERDRRKGVRRGRRTRHAGRVCSPELYSSSFLRF